MNLGAVLADQGKLPGAIEHYERVLQIKPDYIAAHYSFGTVLANQGKLPEAIEHFERALQIKPDYIDAHINLGTALANQGKLPEAIPHFQQALNLAMAKKNTALTELIRTQLKLYQGALPHPQTP